jgi:hypothetical protein
MPNIQTIINTGVCRKEDEDRNVVRGEEEVRRKERGWGLKRVRRGWSGGKAEGFGVGLAWG